MMKRKYIPLITLGLLVGSLMTACGNSSVGSTAPGSSLSATATTATIATVAATSIPPASSAGGASINAPFVQTVNGSQCLAGQGAYKGKAAFGFPNRDLPTAKLAFTLGPLTDGSSPGQENNAPYIGASTYTNIGIVVRSASGTTIAGYGTIVVNTDLQTGTFQVNAASGSWNCGSPVNP